MKRISLLLLVFVSASSLSARDGGMEDVRSGLQNLQNEGPSVKEIQEKMDHV